MKTPSVSTLNSGNFCFVLETLFMTRPFVNFVLVTVLSTYLIGCPFDMVVAVLADTDGFSDLGGVLLALLFRKLVGPVLLALVPGLLSLLLDAPTLG